MRADFFVLRHTVFAMTTLATRIVCPRAVAMGSVISALSVCALAQVAPPALPPSAAVQSGVCQTPAVGARLRVRVDRTQAPADGQSAVGVALTLLDAKGQPLPRDEWATVEVSGARLLLTGAKTDEAGPRGIDADATAPGVQVALHQGQAQLNLLAPMRAQDVRLRVSAAGLDCTQVVSFVAPARDMLAVGLIEGVIRFHGAQAVGLNPVRQGDGFERALSAWSRQFDNGRGSAGARAALFLQGSIQGRALLSAAYDSDKETRARALRDFQPEEFYPVYGDASLKGQAPKSDSRLYVRVDHHKSYVLFGDFATGDGAGTVRSAGQVNALQQRVLGQVNRSATGLRWHHADEATQANAFAFSDSLRQVVEEFTAQGSGPYGLRNNAVLEGSEKLELVVRDRNQPSRILSSTALQRVADYSFEPFSGRIVLNRFLSAFDAELNPVSLRVSYELDQGGASFWVTGLDGQTKLSPGVEVGASWVKDHNPLAPSEISSANLGLQFGAQTRLVAELAHSSETVNTNTVNTTVQPGLQGRVGEVGGNAWRVELVHEQENADLRAFVGRSDAGFQNLAAPLVGAKGEASVRASVKVGDGLSVYTQAERSEDRNPGMADRTGFQVGLKARLGERVTLDVGLRTLRETAGATAGVLAMPYTDTAGLGSSLGAGAGGGAVGFGNQAVDPQTGLPIVTAGNTLGTPLLGSSHSQALRSESVRAGLGVRLSPAFSLGGELEHSVAGQQRQRLALGGDYQIAERTRLYGRWERQTGLTGTDLISTPEREGHALVLGVQNSSLRETELFSEYRLRDALSGRDVQQASGVRNAWDLAPGLRLNTVLEHTQVLSGAAPDTSAAGLGLDYSGAALWRASTKLEYRVSGDLASTHDNERFGTRLWQAMVARKLDRDWTMLARNYLLATDYAARGDVFQNRLQLGLAYRDTDTNRINALGKLEFKNERDSSDAQAGLLLSRATIASLHADWHARRPWWVSGRFAAKWQQDRFGSAPDDRFRAQFVSGRLVADLSENWDLGLMAAAQLGQGGARQSAIGLELGYLVRQNLWLSLGHNRTGFVADRDLSGYDTTQRGSFLRLRFKFDENLFMHDNPGVNRSLDRPATGAK